MGSPLVIISCLIAFTVADLADVADVKEGTPGVRNPKLFLVSSTTVTLSTTTLCYSSSTAAAACGKRKKRALVIASAAGDIAVTKSGASDSSHNMDAELTAGQEEAKDLLYWKTTTSTSTSYTATTTISALACTPSGFTISNLNVRMLDVICDLETIITPVTEDPCVTITVTVVYIIHVKFESKSFD